MQGSKRKRGGGEMEDEDLYKVLGLAGPDASQPEIRKAYRGLALLWHPDKQAGKKPADVATAAVEFEKAQKAHEVLGDEKARNAYDKLWKLRKSRVEKEKSLSAERQKMKQDLRKGERAFETETSERQEEELVKTQLQAELARIREEDARKRKNAAAGYDLFSPAKSQSGSASKSQPASTPAQAREMQNTLKTTLKVSWTCTDGGAGGYTVARLKEIFQKFGVVEDVVIRDGKVRKTGSALVVMSSKSGAIVASEAPCGNLSNPLKVVPMMPPPAAAAEKLAEATVAPVNAAGLVGVVGSGYRSFENDVLTKLRHAAERARLIKEMQKAD